MHDVNRLKKKKHLFMLFPDGYTTDEVVYVWAGGDEPVRKYGDITMAQFTLNSIHHNTSTHSDHHGKEWN